MVTGSEDPRMGQIPPLGDWHGLEPHERVEELRARTEFALQTGAASAERAAAAGWIIGIGNYEHASGSPDDAVMQAVEARLKEIEEDERSRYWG
jgi:hypothetical protein